jgi:hypothetical protein
MTTIPHVAADVAFDACVCATRSAGLAVPDRAEREGFEPPDPCGPTVFKTVAFVHSATAPSRSSHTRYAPRSTRRGG